MNDRKSSTSSSVLTTPFSYFSIDFSEKNLPQTGKFINKKPKGLKVVKTHQVADRNDGQLA